MYCVRNSSGRHTRPAPCCAASRMRATALARFASESSLMLICTSPILNLSGIPFMPNNNSEGLARRQDDSQLAHVLSLLRSRGRRRVTAKPPLGVRAHDGGAEPGAHQTLGAGAAIGSTAKASTTTLPPSELPVPAALPRSDPK